MPQDKRPDKKVYSITPAGRTALIEALGEPPGPDRFRSDFLFVLFLAEQMSGAQLRRLIDDRIALYEERISAMESRIEGACQIEAGPAFVHGFGLALYKGARDYLLANRDRFLEEAEGGQRLVAE